MELTDFSFDVSACTAQPKSVIVFSVNEYSPLLLHNFVSSFQKKYNHAVQKIDIDQNIDDIARQLQTTFLGQSFIFWFSDLSLVTSKKRKTDLLNFLKSYQGPHIVIGCIPAEGQESFAHGDIITIQPQYTKEQLMPLLWLFDQYKHETVAHFFSQIFKLRKQYSLEQIYFLLQYATVLGKNSQQFFQEWMNQLVVNDVSLYYLSQLLFEKKSAEFFDVWGKVRGLYSDQFWTAYFSDQFFKAYWFIVWRGNIAMQHKPMIYGLPFSFIKNDWKLYKPCMMQSAHDKIYQVDIALKTGASLLQLDQFLLQFFKGF